MNDHDAVRLLLIVHAAATFMLAGLILVIQLVHYPLFRLVGESTYTQYQLAHMNSITCLVFPLMAVEAGTGLLLLVLRPPGVAGWQVAAGFILIAVVWVMTAFVNAPQHAGLVNGYNAATHQALVASNWVRTLAWCARGALVAWMLWHTMRAVPA
jgi:hypothetical protein